MILFHLQEDLQLALRVSSEEDLGGDGDSDGDLVRQPKGQKKKGSCEPSKKETGLAVITDEGSIVLGDSDDECDTLSKEFQYRCPAWDRSLLTQFVNHCMQFVDL